MCIFLISIHEIIGYVNIIYHEMKIYLSRCYMRVEVIDIEQTKNEAKRYILNEVISKKINNRIFKNESK